MAQQIIIACSTDGRLRVFINEKQCSHGEEEEDRINEEEFEEDDEDFIIEQESIQNDGQCFGEHIKLEEHRIHHTKKDEALKVLQEQDIDLVSQHQAFTIEKIKFDPKKLI